MARITDRGRALAQMLKIHPSRLGMAQLEACSIIASRAKTHHSMAEIECSGHPAGWRGGGQSWFHRLSGDAQCKLNNESVEWARKRSESLERSIVRAVKLLGRNYGVRFEGDPRGCTVAILTPDRPEDGVCAQW